MASVASIGSRESHLVVEDERRNELLQLQQCDVLSQANASTCAKLQLHISKTRPRPVISHNIYRQEELTVSTLLSSLLRRSSSSPNHLSGRHTSASSPNVGRCRFTTHGLMPTTVPALKNCPQIMTPPSGTTRSKGKQNGGCRRIPSLMQASRYGRSLTSFHVGNGRVRPCFCSTSTNSS